MMLTRASERYAWLESAPVRRTSDLVLGSLLLAAAVVALLGTRHLAASWAQDGRLVPSLLAGLMASVGTVLCARAALSPAPLMRRPAWQLWLVLGLALLALGLYAATVIGTVLGIVFPPSYIFLIFGRADLVALIVLALSVVIALAGMSRLQTAGMVLLGLLLATVGTDPESGEVRLTMGVTVLEDGFPFNGAGLLWVADSIVCLVSPALLVATYTRRISGWRDRAISAVAAAGMRIVAVLVIAASFYLLSTAGGDAVDVGSLALFGLLGVACKGLAWSRLALLFGFACGPVLELYIRQALVISRGDPSTFFYRPLSAAILTVAAAVLVLTIALSLRRRAPAPEAA